MSEKNLTPRIRKLDEVDEAAERRAYWLSRPPAERLAEVERLRRLYYGEDYDAVPRSERTDRISFRKMR